METWHWVLVVWLVFDVIVYLIAWADDYYYSHDVKTKLSEMKKLLTEE
jgi:hypothetical protein